MVYPEVPLRRKLEGRETLLSIDLARRVLGYEPAHAGRTTSRCPERARTGAPAGAGTG